MPERLYVPVQQYLDQLLPSNLVDLPDLELLDQVWMEPPNITDSPFSLRTAFMLETELAIGIPGLDAVRLVFGAEGAQTAFVIEVVTDPVPAIHLVDLPVVLRFDKKILQPVRRVPGEDGADAWEVDPEREFVDVTLAKVTLGIDFEGNLDLQTDLSIDLPPSMIGQTGVVVEAAGVQIYLGAGTPPAGKPAGWRGVRIGRAGLSLPGELAGIVGHLEVLDASIGNGGFSGTVSDTWTPPLTAKLFGLELGLQRAAVTFVQNTLTEFDIVGSVRLPFFDEPVDVELGIDLDGSLTVALSSASGLVTLSKPGLLNLTVDGLGFQLDGGKLTVSLSGSLTPDLAGIDWPTLAVKELSIDSEGHVHLDGGWLDLPDQYALEFYGFTLEITKLGFGRAEDGGKWFGFSGALKLVEGLPAGASVDGLRVTWYDDSSGRPPRVSLDGVGVEFEVPEVLRFKGAIAYRELPGGIHRFDGAIKLELVCIDLEIDATLVIGSAPGYTFFAIYLGVELPAGIPLGSTGLGLYGMAGLFAYQMEPDRHPDEKWYGIGPNEGWYKRDTIGVTDLKAKWRPEAGSLALGAGVTIGTVSDNGFTFAGKVLLVIVFPGPIIMLEGKANLLKERSTLSDEPIFRSLAVLDFRNGFVQIGLDAHYLYDQGGELLDIRGGVEAYFDFHDAGAWHLYIGEKDPRERRIRAAIFQLFQANAYFMLDSRRLQTGAWVGYDNRWQFGPLSVTLEVWLEGDADVSFKPPHFRGGLWLHGKIALSVFGFGLSLEADARCTADVFDPFHLLFELHVAIDLPWFLPDFSADATLEWGPDPTPPPLPLPLKEIAVEHFKVTTAWPLPRAGAAPLLLPSYDGDTDGFLDPASGGTVPADPKTIPVVPLDARPHVTFGRTVHDDAGVGVNPQPVLPGAQPQAGWEWLGDPAANQGPARARYALAEIWLERLAGTAWKEVACAPAKPGVAELYGSWAPVPALPAGEPAAGSAPPVANAKLWLWSKTPFDWSRHAGRAWDEWFDDAFPGYPCPQVPPDRTVCCDFESLPIGTVLASPWTCPGHPELEARWTAPALGRVTALPMPVGGRTRALCFPGTVRRPDGTTVDVVVTVGVSGGGKKIQVHLPRPPSTTPVRCCVDFAGEALGTGPNPRTVDRVTFTAHEPTGAPAASTRVVTAVGQQALDCRFRLDAEPPVAADWVEVTLVHFSTPARIEVLDAGGTRLDTVAFSNPRGQPETQRLRGPGIRRVVVTAPEDEMALLRLCYGLPPLVVTGHDGHGNTVPVTVGTDGTVTATGSPVDSVDLKAAEGVCITGVCGTYPPDPGELQRQQEMTKHLVDELARWSQAGEVLEPGTTYRLKVVTTLEVKDFQHDPTFNRTRTQTEYAYFRTEGPPALAPGLSVPLGTPDPVNYSSGLDDLTAYIQQTVPETVPAPGQRPPLPRPVYRAYDVGVRFNEDYVDLLYRAGGRDLGLYLYDNSNQPVRDAVGRLVVLDNLWGRAEERTARESEQRWFSMLYQGTCAKLDLSQAPRDRTLTIAGGAVLAADTVYEARLVPQLAHDDGSRGLAGWQPPVDQGSGGPSAWAARYHPALRGQAATANGTKLTLDGSPNLTGLDPAFDVVVLDADSARPSRRYRIVQVDAANRTLTLDATPTLPAGGSTWAIPALGALVQTSAIGGGTDAGNDPVKPGTMLLTGDPGWTDYRVRVLVRSSTSGAVGVVVRAGSTDSYYRFSMDRTRRYRRLVRVVGGAHTILAEDDFVYETATDYLVTVEAVGDSLRVDQDGEPVFAVRDATLTSGRAGLYTWKNTGARFADVRVDDFRAAAPVAYRFAFTTSKFANFFHHLHSYQDETWLLNGNVAALEPRAVPPATAPGEQEQRDYEAVAATVLGQAATARPEQTEVARLQQGGQARGFLVRTPEPIDWRRVGVQLTRAERALARTEPPGAVKLTAASFAVADPNEETVDLLLRDPADVSGWSVERRALPAALAEPGEDALLALDRFGGPERGALLREDFGPNALDHYTIVDEEPPGLVAPSAWTVVGGHLVQTGNYMGGGSTEAGIEKPGTLALTGDGSWSDVRITATLRSEDHDDIGLAFRWRDERHYYRFSMSRYGGYRRLVKRDGAAMTVLWQDQKLYTLGVSHRLVVETWGDRLVGWLDDGLLFSVRDGGLEGSAGRAGFYCWRNPAAHFEGLEVEALEASPVAWQPAFADAGEVATFDDPTTVFGPSVWDAQGGVLRQTSSIGAPAGPPTALAPGTFAVGGDDQWEDVQVSVRLRSETGGAIGVLFRYLDGAHHYRLSMSAARFYRRLVRKEGDTATVLWEDQGPFDMNTTYELTLRADGSQLSGLLDGVPLFTVHDQTFARGRVGLYCSDNPGARFERLLVADRTRRVGGWTVRDDGITGRPSSWRLTGGALVQASAIGGGTVPEAPGTMAVRGARRWTDYRATVRLRADAPGAVGVVFRHADGGSWYRLSLDAQRDERSLVRCASGTTTTLWQSQGSFPVGEPFELTVEAVGSRLRGYLGRTRLFEVDDAIHPSGRVGLYCWNNPSARFERVEVRQAPLEASALFLDNFAAAGTNGWTIVDEGSVGAPSTWSAQAGMLRQTSPIHTPPIDRATVAKLGTRAVTGSLAWRELILTARLQSPTGETIGVVFGVTARGDYHRFSMDEQQGYRRLVRADGGTFKVLWEDDAGYEPGRPYDLAIVVRDGWMRGFLDEVPLFAVREPARAGRVGMYCWHNTDARFSNVRVYPASVAFGRWLLDERFDPNRPHRWMIVDEGEKDAPSNWVYGSGGLSQSSPIRGGGDAATDPAKPGTSALGGDPWDDFRFTTILSSGDPDAIGVVFRYADAGNYYRFSMDRARSYRRLVRVQDGTVTVLWEDAVAYELDRDYLLTIDCLGELLRGFLDGVPLFAVTDGAHAAGRVGLYCWGNSAARFREIRVGAPVFTPWCVLGAEEPLPAGARMRVHAGRGNPGEDAGIEHRYAAQLDDRGRITLTLVHAELRLRTPEKGASHARSFLPPGDYGHVPVRVLRKADGTGVALFPQTPGLQPGQYRLPIEFHRDNRAADPGSIVLRQAGSAAPELVDLDIPWLGRD